MGLTGSLRRGRWPRLMRGVSGYIRAPCTTGAARMATNGQAVTSELKDRKWSPISLIQAAGCVAEDEGGVETRTPTAARTQFFHVAFSRTSQKRCVAGARAGGGLLFYQVTARKSRIGREGFKCPTNPDEYSREVSFDSSQNPVRARCSGPLGPPRRRSRPFDLVASCPAGACVPGVDGRGQQAGNSPSSDAAHRAEAAELAATLRQSFGCRSSCLLVLANSRR